MQNNVSNTTKNNGSEAIKLLEISSSDSLDSPSFAQFQTPKPKRKVRFKKPFRPNSKSKNSSSTKRNYNCHVVEGAKIIACFLMFTLVGTLLWYVISLGGRVQELQEKFNDIEAGNRNTPEALHSIHSKLKQLDSNVTSLYLDIRKNIIDLDNASSEIKLLKETTSNLQASIAAAPAIQQLPKDVHSLSESVAGFGSKITALETTVKELKDLQSVFQSTTQTLSGELDSVKTVVQELSNATKTNNSDVQSKPSMLFGNLPIQSAIQETNQLATYVQKELMDIVTSVDKMNSSLSNQIIAFKDLSTKVETINNAVIYIINDTHGQSGRILTLENYTYTNLTLRLDHLETDKQIDNGKYHNSETPSDIQEYLNKSISKALVNVLNSEFILNEQLDMADNFTIKVMTQAHNYLVLMDGLLKELNPIEVSDILNAKNANEQITRLLNSTFHDVIKEQDSKIQALEENLTNLTVHVMQHNDLQVTSHFEVTPETQTLLSNIINSTELVHTTERNASKDEVTELVTEDKS